jgi:ribosomal protein L4
MVKRHGRVTSVRPIGAEVTRAKGWIQNYETKLNKKVRKLGLKHALSQKLLEEI